MIAETTPCFKALARLFSPKVFMKSFKRLSAHDGGVGRLQARRHFGVSRCLTAKAPPPRKPREKVEIPGLEVITYGDRMHFVPGLAKPVYPLWERDYKDPRFYKSPPLNEMQLFKEKPCYVVNQRTNMLEGNASCTVTHYLGMSPV